MTFTGVVFLLVTGGIFATSPNPDVGGELDARRLLGRAYYENAETPPQFEPAAEQFRRCTELAPGSAIDRFNLGLTLMRGEKFDEALKLLNESRQLDPKMLAATYVTGIVYKRLGQIPEAIACLEQVIQRNPQCAGAYYNLGVCYKRTKEREKAVAVLVRAVELRPTHPNYHYQLMILYRDMGQVDNVKRHKEIFDLVKDTLDASEKTQEALERSQYSYILEAPRLTADLVPDPGAKARFVDVTADLGLPAPVTSPPPSPLPQQIKREDYSEEEAQRRYVPTVGGAVSLGDFDSDGDLDIYVANCASVPEASANRLYRNEGNWRFTDVTDDFGVGDTHMGMAVVFGDYDYDYERDKDEGYEDRKQDIYVVNYGPNVLYRKQGHGEFEVGGLETDTDNGVALLKLDAPLPEMVEIVAEIKSQEVPELRNNGFIIFDYQGPDNFKFAGGKFKSALPQPSDTDAASGMSCWVIGHYDGSWVNDVHLNEGIPAGQFNTINLRLKGSVAAIVDAGENIEKVSHDFGKPITGGRLGLAANHAVTCFDDVVVREPARDATATDIPAKVLFEETFKDGSAARFQEISGTWKVLNWKYEEVSEHARVQEPQFGRKAVFMDYDHDNDLDIFVVNSVELFLPPETEAFALPADFPGQFNTLLRNNGNGIFTVQTDEARLLVDCSQTVDVLFTDFDGDNDTDLFIVNANAPSLLFLNARMGKFDLKGSFSPPLGKDGRTAAERDFNRDGYPDLLFATGNQLYLYTNDGQANFTGRPLELPATLAAGGVGRIDILDYNNDGWADLMLGGADGNALALMAGLGPNQFHDVSKLVGLETEFGKIADFDIADLDGDGDEDIALLTRDRGLHLLRNDGGNKGHWVTIRLVGKKVNRNGYGALVEIAGGGHYQKQTAADGWVHFGLGNLEGVDIIRATWPNGQAQNLVRPSINGEVPFEQYVKVSTSCGFLYAYNGRGFELINEILGIGPLGVPMSPGVYYPIDNTELTKIEARQFAPRDGFYELRLTEELNETTYADQITLRVVDHPAELELIPNEKFQDPPPDDKFFAVGDHRRPVSAVDDRGVDVLPLILEHDGRFPTFPLVGQYDGLAQPHALVIDLGDLSGADRIMLYLDSWIYWSESSVSMAIGQDPRYELTPLKLEVRDAQGRWHTAIESVGLPTSKGIIIPEDLTGRFLCDDYHIRFSTTMCVFFDRIFVSTHDQADRCRMVELPVAHADLHYRGFSSMIRDEFGFERFNYADVSLTGSWNPPGGCLTRYGMVTELLHRVDDRYVIFGPGDELAMRFDASSLPNLPPGWVRDFIFYADGWVKDGDLNTKFSETVTPLPFHAMSTYPYPADEHYPDTPKHRRYLETYNTRRAAITVGRLSPVEAR